MPTLLKYIFSEYLVVAVVLLTLVTLLLLQGISQSTSSVQARSTIIETSNVQTIALATPDTSSGHFGRGGALSAVVITNDGAALPTSSPIDTYSPSVDSSTDQISVYVVRTGDTLSEIAEMFDVSVNTIIWANNIDDGNVQPGDTLIILPITGVRHIVKEGETLDSIAQKYKGDTAEIRRFNNLSRKLTLEVGVVLDIPNGEVEPPKKVKVAAKKPAQASSSWLTHPLPGSRRTQGIHGYNGVDLAKASGSNVMAAASGEVVIARSGWNGGYGTYVVINHSNGTQTLYSHLSDTLVSPGQWINQGQVIGFVGNTGRSTGPHLHFEVRGATNPF